MNLKFSRESWHYGLVNKFTPFYPGDIYNLCSYFWVVVLGLVILTLISSFVSYMLVGASWDVAWLLGYVQYVDPKSPEWKLLATWPAFWASAGGVFNVFGIVALILVGIFLAAAGIDKYQDYKMTKRKIVKEESQPGFLKASYRAFKDKVCFKINFV